MPDCYYYPAQISRAGNNGDSPVIDRLKLILDLRNNMTPPSTFMLPSVKGALTLNDINQIYSKFNSLISCIYPHIFAEIYLKYIRTNIHLGAVAKQFPSFLTDIGR